MHKIIISIIFITISNFVIAQETLSDSRLATEYYQSKDFDKSEVLYKKLFDKTKAKIYFTYYINCLIEQKKFKEAKKKIKKQIRRNRRDISYLVDLGYLYKKQDLPEDAKKQFDVAVNKISKSNVSVVSVANAFIRRQEYEYAIKAYNIAAKKNKRKYNRELARIYTMQRKYKKMVECYLDLAAEKSSNEKTVQNNVQYYLSNDINDEFSNIFRTALLRRIQGNNTKYVYSNLLIWYFMQRKEFEKALFQAKALDMRVRGNGRKIMEIAETAVSNSRYETALSAYKYIINVKGNRNYYFLKAKSGRLNVLYKQVINSKIQSKDEIAELEKEFIKTINSIGDKTEITSNSIDLAHIQAFYLNKPQKAEKLLTETIKKRNLSKKMIARCKIELGDILVFQNDLDYPALIYGQAEKDNTENEYGDIAKLRKAKLAYYRCNFKWAKAQFDALKKSTSKPVANDALHFSIFIDDNIKDDSLMNALKIYSRADLLTYRKQNDSALITLDSIINEYPAHQIIDEVYMKKAEIFDFKNKYDDEIKYLKKIITERSQDILADVAVFKLAVIYEEKLKNKDEAAEFYKKLMLEYPDSIYTTEARKRFRAIRDSQK